MESFYGGLPGQSFIIRKSYSSVETMITNFCSEEKDVWYGDYVLIDTPNKNNKDNGKIFKRLSGATEETCYEYIGQIVGPASGTPYIIGSELNANAEEDFGELINKMKEALVAQGTEKENVDFAYLDEENTLIHESGTNFRNNNGILQIKTESGSYKNVAINQQTFTEGLDFVPGYAPADPTTPDSTEIYHDTIKWGWCNVRTNNENNDSMYYIGFQIPYPVFELSGEWVSGYDVDGNKRLSLDVFAYEEEKGRNHKFYYPYKIEMPNSRIPYAVRNIRHIQYTDAISEGNPVYLPESFKFVWDTTTTPPDWKFVLYEDEETEYPKILDLSYLNSTYDLGFNLSTEDAEEIAGESTEIWVYDLYIYEDYLEKEPTFTKVYTVFAGLYNVISAYPSIKLVRETATGQELITLVSQQPSDDKSTLIYKDIFSFFNKDINKNPYELPVLWGDVL